MPSDLSPMQRAFVDYYTKNPDPRQAAIEAGYSARHIARTVRKLMEIDHPVRQAIDARVEQAKEEFELDPLWILERLKEEAEGRHQKSTGNSRVKALELLGKWAKLWVEEQKQPLFGQTNNTNVVILPADQTVEEYLQKHKVIKETVTEKA